MKHCHYAALAFIAVCVACLGCGPPPTAYEGRWVEQMRARWEGTTDEYYSHYTQEFERQGPCEFVFQGDRLTVSRQGRESHFLFDLTDVMEPDEHGDLRPRLAMVLWETDSYKETKGYLEKHSDDRILVWWPESETPKTDEEYGQVVEVCYDPVELARQPASE